MNERLLIILHFRTILGNCKGVTFVLVVMFCITHVYSSENFNKIWSNRWVHYPNETDTVFLKAQSNHVTYLLTEGPGTIEGAAKKLTALPRLLNTNAIPVAVVLSPGGNQAEESADGAENTMIPAMPFKIAQI